MLDFGRGEAFELAVVPFAQAGVGADGSAGDGGDGLGGAQGAAEVAGVDRLDLVALEGSLERGDFALSPGGGGRVAVALETPFFVPDGGHVTDEE